MINVCFGESERGLIKNALKNQKTETSYTNLGYGTIDSKNFTKSREEGLTKIYPCCSELTLKGIVIKERQRFDRIT